MCSIRVYFHNTQINKNELIFMPHNDSGKLFHVTNIFRVFITLKRTILFFTMTFKLDSLK